MSSHTLELTDTLHDYLLRHGTRESVVARALRAETRTATRMHAMQVSPEQGAFMQWLIKLIGARRTIEMGTFTGYSALVVAEALPADGQVIACDVSDEWTAIGRPFWDRAGVAGKIDLRLRPAVETLDALIRDWTTSANCLCSATDDTGTWTHPDPRRVRHGLQLHSYCLRPHPV